MASRGGFTTPSDLAEYAYCPRAHYYRHHPPPEGRTAESTAGSRAGERYHRRVLSAERRRAERGKAYWAGALVGVALLAGGIAAWAYFL